MRLSPILRRAWNRRTLCTVTSLKSGYVAAFIGNHDARGNVVLEVAKDTASQNALNMRLRGLETLLGRVLIRGLKTGAQTEERAL